MIHHVSIPARDPKHVASVLAELLGGYAGPFVGPFAGAYVAYAEDDFGTGFEVYPDDLVLEPGDTMARGVKGEPPKGLAFHALVSVKVGREDIERIAAREGWRCQHDWRGPKGMKLFELYELWVENRVLLEIATEDMLAGYVKIARGSAQKEIFAKLAASR
jgi:hypothetical protein